MFKFLTAILVTLVISACGHQPGAPSISSTPDTAPSVTPAPLVTTNTPVTPVTPTTAVFTYYSRTQTVAPFLSESGNKYTATGNCGVYNGTPYCWDDGVKTTLSAFTGTKHWSYFNISVSGGVVTSTFGTLVADFMVASPTRVDGPVGAMLAVGAYNAVVNSGTPTDVTCNILSNGNLDCGSFVVDVNQAAR
jgi:hypothetical protein